MSFQSVEKAFHTKGIPKSLRCTLLYLAKYDGMPGYVPTNEQLADDMECTVRQVQRDLRELEKLGRYKPGLTIGGRGNSTPYQLAFEDWVETKVAKDYNKGKKARIAKAKVIHIHTRQEVKVDELPDFLFKEING